MNIPLSQKDKEEILNAYKKTTADIKASATSLEALVQMLEQKMACVDPESRKALVDSSSLVGSNLFKLGVLRFKIQNANLQGREFVALDASSSGL